MLGAPARATELERPIDVASYTLDISVNVQKKRLTGRGKITLLNTSPVALRELCFQLYLNAFKDQRTLFQRSLEPADAARRPLLDPANAGWLEVHSLRAPALSPSDLWQGQTPHSAGEPNDETSLRVPLPSALAPGETLELEVEFTAQLPLLTHRTGHSRDFLFAGQWFPKLAKLDPQGNFVHFPFHSQAEFFADFGRYDITLHVPAELEVLAPGRLLEQSSQGGQKKVRYLLEGAHDFAFSAWSGFRERKLSVLGVEVTIGYPAWQATNAQRSLWAIERALPSMVNRYGSYPYPTLVVVHPPEFASGAGGMEYPGLITTGGRWFDAWLGSRAVEIVTVHELAHQWFYGLVATNEVESPFLDEGLTTLAELQVMRELFGESSAASAMGLQISLEALHRAAAAWYGPLEPILQPAASFSSWNALGGLAYSRTAITLLTLGRVFGQERLERALSDYALSFRFQHPEPQDLFNVLERHYGPELRRSLEKVFKERATIDYEVVELSSEERPDGLFVGNALVVRHGELSLPVEVELHTRAGGVERRHWDGLEASMQFTYEGSSPLLLARVDPDTKILLDQNLLNNSKRVEPAPLYRTHALLAALVAAVTQGLFP